MHRTLKCALGALPAIMGVLLLGGCPPQPAGTPPPFVAGSNLRAEYVVAAADHPSALAFPEDGRVFYAEKNTGQIRVVKDGVLLEAPFATMPVNFAGDRGLLSIALHPGFKTNGRVYAFYTRSDTGQSSDDPQAVVDHRVVYFTATETGSDVSTGAEVFVVSLPTASSLTRIGGRIGFAPDRALLVALGDLGDPDSAQDPDSPLGKILRYHDDGTVPRNNPSPDSAVYALGFCEPRGLTFDPQSGAPFVTERSADGFNEINLVQSGSNYGWPLVVGWADTPDELDFVAQHPEYGEPLAQSRGTYVGAAFDPSGKYGPSLRLRLFYGLSDAAGVFSLELSLARTAAVAGQEFARGFPSAITDVAFTPAGTLYVACADAVLRVVPLSEAQ
jgi:glucose/arabinose dehydrogenase